MARGLHLLEDLMSKFLVCLGFGEVVQGKIWHLLWYVILFPACMLILPLSVKHDSISSHFLVLETGKIECLYFSEKKKLKKWSLYCSLLEELLLLRS